MDEQERLFPKILTNKFIVGGVAFVIGDAVVKRFSEMSMIDLLPKLKTNFMGIDVGGYMSLCLNAVVLSIIFGNTVKAVIEVRTGKNDAVNVIVREVIQAVLLITGLYILIALGNALIADSQAFKVYL